MNLQQNKPYVSASTLKTSVQILAPTYGTQTDEGKTPVSFAQVAEVWGDWRPDGNDRVLEDLKLTYNKAGRLFIRYNTDIREDYKVAVYDITYAIHSINDVGNKHQYYELLLRTDARIEP